MSTRRKFLKQTGLAVGAAALPNMLFSYERLMTEKYQPGLQLYTIRDAMVKAPEDSLKRVSDIGYQLVEHATYSGTGKFYGMDAETIKKVLDRYDLQMTSGHYAMEAGGRQGTLKKGWEKAVEDAHKVGLKYMVCPFLTNDQRKDLDAYKRCAEEFNKAGEVCKKAGIQFCYHNHNFEFIEMQNVLPMELLLKETDEDLVKFEMDIFWVTRAGYDPVELFSRNPGRYVLWHVKDMKQVDDQGTTDLQRGGKAITEVGNGVIDWPTIFGQARRAGMKNFFVEQDVTPGDPFESIKTSFSYLKRAIL